MRNSFLLTALAGLAGLTLLGTPAHAQVGFHGLYVGGAAVRSDVDGATSESGVGSHFFAGVDLFSLPALARFGVEGGYLQTRRFTTATGRTRIANPAISATATLMTLRLLDFHARVGYEDGDTSGMFQAVGATLKVYPTLGLRAEYTNNNGFDAVSLGLQMRLR